MRMKRTLTIQLRVFFVHVKDERTGEVTKDRIIFTKQELQAAQMVGESSINLIYRAYNRRGYRVVDTITAVKREVVLDLEALWKGRQETPLDLMGILDALEKKGEIALDQ